VFESRTHSPTHHQKLNIYLENCEFHWFVLYDIQTTYVYS